MLKVKYLVVALFGLSLSTVATAQMSPEEFLAGYQKCEDNNTSPTVYTNCLNKLMADKNGTTFTPLEETAPKPRASNATIINKCKSDWPADFEMQEHCQTKQYEALKKWNVVKDSTDSLLGPAVSKCNTDWPADYEMKFHCYEKQGEGLKALSTYFEGSTVQVQSIATQCVSKWTPDLEMAAYCTEKQVSAYNRLNP